MFQNIWGVIYSTRNVFPYEFNWGYADSGVITPKKSFITQATNYIG